MSEKMHDISKQLNRKLASSNSILHYNLYDDVNAGHIDGFRQKET